MFQKRKEIEEFSRALDALLSGQALSPPSAYEDTLPSKIRSQLSRLSDQMYSARKREEDSRRQLQCLIAETAHQMRTPLANLESYLSLLSDAPEQERGHLLSAAQASQERLHFLTESFIKMARLENRVIQIQKRRLDLNETVLSAILQVQQAAEAKRIEISLSPNEPFFLSHDANWLCEAVYNLLDNSVKYSPAASAVSVSLARNEMFSRISVRDMGCGIAEGEEAKIFQRFYRGANSALVPGFGLGLALSREIVGRHGGFLKAKRLFPGLEISVYLPAD